MTSEQDIRSAIANSVSYAGALRLLDKKPQGGSISNLNLRCRRLGIDVSHLTGQGHRKGKRSNRRRSPDQVLIMGTPLDMRVAAHKLRAALIEIGRELKCTQCPVTVTWNGKPITLEIDHIDGKYWNNTAENLQFMCPCCHSQKGL